MRAAFVQVYPAFEVILRLELVGALNLSLLEQRNLERGYVRALNFESEMARGILGDASFVVPQNRWRCVSGFLGD